MANPVRDDIIGLWGNSDGAELTFSSDGTFSASRLPSRLFFRADQPNELLSGSGVWRLEKGRPYWEVRLSFREIMGRTASYGTAILISGKGAAVYLYQWEDEEGGARYIFRRADGNSESL